MNQEQIWLKFSSLPPQAQQLVLDFMAFLQKSYTPPQTQAETPSIKLADEEFIGMWRNREDMEDSSAWTRNVRKSEWAEGT